VCVKDNGQFTTDDNSPRHLNQDANPDSRSTSFEGQIQMIQYDGITIRDVSITSAHSDEAKFANFPSVDVSVHIITDNKFKNNIKLIRLCAAFLSPIVYVGYSVFSILNHCSHVCKQGG
jgi:hypothetical protein